MKEVALSRLRQHWPDLAKVVDAKVRNNFQVSKANSARGVPGDPAKCAAALSLGDALVYKTVAYIRTGVVAVRFRVPESVRTEEAIFDRTPGAVFAPGSYHLSPFAPAKHVGVTRPKTGATGRKRQPHQPHHITLGMRTV